MKLTSVVIENSAFHEDADSFVYGHKEFLCAAYSHMSKSTFGTLEPINGEIHHLPFAHAMFPVAICFLHRTVAPENASEADHHFECLRAIPFHVRGKAIRSPIEVIEDRQVESTKNTGECRNDSEELLGDSSFVFAYDTKRAAFDEF